MTRPNHHTAVPPMPLRMRERRIDFALIHHRAMGLCCQRGPNDHAFAWIAFFVLLLGSAGICTAEQDADGFRPMFDGKTLDGWTVTPANAAKAWSVQEGMIVGEGDKGRSYLVYNQVAIADFEIKVRYRFPGKGNSGISIRAQKDRTGKRAFRSYHADFGHVGIGRHVLGAWDFHTPNRREHACFRGDRLVIDEDDQPTLTKIDGALTIDDVHKGGWNDVHLIAKGNRFQFFINGKPASEFIEHLPAERRLDRGMIQLQLHDPGMVVQFKDLRIKILD